MNQPLKPVVSGDICPECNAGHVEVYCSPKPRDGVEFRTRYLRCSRHEQGCRFAGKQILPEAVIVRRA